MTDLDNPERRSDLALQISTLKQDAARLARTHQAQVKLFNENLSALLQQYHTHVPIGKWLGHHPTQVQEGQRYQSVFRFLGRNGHFNVHGRPPVWEVRSISTDFLSLPHARLVNREDPCDVRTVSCHAIAEGRFFKLVSQPEQQAEPSAEAA
jgi:hypothetical protein